MKIEIQPMKNTADYGAVSKVLIAESIFSIQYLLGEAEGEALGHMERNMRRQ